MRKNGVTPRCPAEVTMRPEAKTGYSLLGAFLMAITVVSSGCKPDDCVTTQDAFAHDVWAGFMSTSCLQCHSPDGVAVVQENARFVLQPAAYPDFLTANLNSVRQMAKTDFEGKSLLLIKPLGEHGHGGGKVLDAKSDEYAALERLVETLRAGTEETCGGETKAKMPDHVQLLSPAQTLRRTMLHFAGRLPTPEETAKVEGGGLAALDGVFEQAMKEPLFLERLDELFNDVLLTDKFRRNRDALDLLNTTEYPAAKRIRDGWSELSSTERARYNDAIAREPLRLVRHVVENDLPFTEILTADYTLVDDALAEVYGLDDGATGVRKAKIATATGTAIPHAGVLTTPAFLNRYPTTPTNRSRGRASLLLRTFLATDLLKIADRPIDISQITAKDNPTLNHESCIVCHRVMDPIAGAFRGWDERDYELFRPDKPWHDDMLHPGFGKTDLPSERYGSALQWLADQMTADARFDLAAVHIAWRAVSGRELLAYPQADTQNFKLALKAWEAQDAFLQEAKTAFIQNGRRFKPLLVHFIKSEAYRAAHAPGSTADELVTIDPFGVSRLLSPEVLNRKIAATTGIRWRMAWDWDKNRDWLTASGLGMLYGGIDSDNVVTRTSTINGVMSNLATRMASEIACFAVPYDFSKPLEERVLFPLVRREEVPLSAGHEVAGAILNIKRNIVHLHDRLLGETLSVDDPEVEATFQVFFGTWKEGQVEELKGQWMAWPCGIDPTTGEALENDLRKDGNYVERAWMATVAYLLSDYRFLYE